MSCVLRIEGWSIHRDCNIAGEYIMWVNVQRYHRPTDMTLPVSIAVMDWLHTTPDINQAYRWKDSTAALKVYREIFKGMPTRPDGKPNRPLTAFHISVLPIPNGEE